jgi:hypothetical protein
VPLSVFHDQGVMPTFSFGTPLSGLHPRLGAARSGI